MVRVREGREKKNGMWSRGEGMMEEKNRINTRPFFFLLESRTNIYIYIYFFFFKFEGVPNFDWGCSYLFLRVNK